MTHQWRYVGLDQAALGSLAPVAPTDFNWVGGAGGDGDWNSAQDWNPQSVPGGADIAIFATGDSGYTVTGNATIGAIQVNGDELTFAGTISEGTGGRSQFLTVQDGGQVTIGASGAVAGDDLALAAGTLLDVQGSLTDTGGVADLVIVEGAGASMVNSGALVVNALYVQSGASFSGPVTLTDGGNITVDSDSSFNPGFMTLENSGLIYATAADQSGGTLTIGGSIFLSNAGGVLNLASDPGVTLDISGDISGAGTLLVSGGTVELSGTNSYTGFTSVVDGTLQIATPGSLPSSLVFLTDAAFVNEVSSSAYADTVVAGGSFDTVNALAGGVVVFAGAAGTLSFLGGATTSTVLGGSGVLDATGGAAGDLIYGGTSGRDVMYTGAGNSTLVGGAGASLFGNGAGNSVLVAGGTNVLADASQDTGNVTVFCAAGDAISVAGGAGTLTAVVNDSNATIYGGHGTMNVFGGSGSLALDYVVGFGGGTTNVLGFDASRDLISLIGYAQGTAAQVFDNETVSGGNTYLELPDSTRIDLFGVTNLTLANFAAV